MAANGGVPGQDFPNPLAGNPKYQTVRELGAGSFGIVQLAINKQTGEQVAVKFLPRGPDKVTKHVERELRSHSSFCHPHVVLFKEVFLTQSHLAIVMEFCSGGDLFQYVRDRGPLREDEARRFLQQLVIGLDYCHRMGVVNRDIKLENALLDRNKRLLKITDFGYAKTAADSLPKSEVGTPNYAAPEVISGIRRTYDGTKADVWSCGVMLYIMLFHVYPFERPDDPPGPRGFAKVLERTQNVDYRIPSNPRISSACRDFLSHLLVADPDQRLSTAAIMEHPWFCQGLPPGVKSLNDECLRLKPSMEQQQRTDEEIARVVREAMVLPNQMGGPPHARHASLASKSTSGSSELENYDPVFEEAYEAETTRGGDHHHRHQHKHGP
ncbi:hypothetical protein WJX73_002124 [Symbiochloris irregularis]|uniref:Protein kinase domain-containing protein n=1 Tax=Symbiochloris irregularis TaxID=706552 RepID=A0AAW1P611_9CHLO